MKRSASSARSKAGHKSNLRNTSEYIKAASICGKQGKHFRESNTSTLCQYCSDVSRRICSDRIVAQPKSHKKDTERRYDTALDAFKQGRVPERFVLVRQSRSYQTNNRFPKVSIRRELYDQLAQIANESGLSMSELTAQAISFAIDHLEWIEE